MDALLTEPRRLPPWVSTAVRIGFTTLVALAFLSFHVRLPYYAGGLRIVAHCSICIFSLC
jgi:hypothetical protein